MDPITSLDDLFETDRNLAEALRGTSRQFFEPSSPRIYLEVGVKPLHNSTLQFVPTNR